MKYDKDGSRQEQQESFSRALDGKKIPILTLDNKWYQLFSEEGRREIAELEQQLTILLKRLHDGRSRAGD